MRGTIDATAPSTCSHESPAGEEAILPAVVHRFSAIMYGGLFYIPYLLVLVALIVLAVIFAAHVLYVLCKNSKRGWLLTFGIIVGIPVALAFVPTGSDMFSTMLPFLPLLAFYFYCYALRFSVGEWTSDASPMGEIEIDAKDRENKILS